jgi:general secretion pathway protein A
MYMSFYKLRGEPFGITPDPRFLFLSAAHREALAALVYGVSQRKGFISIIGEVGTGKTIILRAFLEGIDPSQTTAISLLNPLANFDQILEEILPPDFEGSSTDRFRTLQEWLIEEYRQGRNVVVAIDEAQCMSPSTMERLRLLSNLETAEHKLIQVVLAGQPELEQKLAQPNLRQFRERIAVAAKIWPLSQSDSVAYINHRLSKVTQPGSKPIFTHSALNFLARKAKGNPRRMNILCDSALLAGFSYQKQPIPWRITWESRSGASSPASWRQPSVVRTLAVAGLIAASVAVAFFGARMTADNVEDLQPSVLGAVSSQMDDTRVAQLQNPLANEIVENPGLSQNEPNLIVMQSGADADVIGGITESVVAPALLNATEISESNNAEFAFASEKVVVNRGDGLWQLCREIYGEVDAAMVRKVIEANPHIPDPNNLTIGQEITFPRLATAGNSTSTRMTNAELED